ncbi:MAG: efflux RND transporter periplasmic adaptor subunit [Acidobacteria bacterium]|nr:efflux RND transporter periplasmic adaptor subunit [Acidobacteriota bacterium]
MQSRTAVYGFLAVAALVGAGGWYLQQNYDLKAWPPKPKTKAAAKSDKPGEEAKAKEDEGVPVEISVAQRGAISSHVLSTANLRALRNVEIKSQAAGVVRSVLVEEGAYVSAGKELATLDDRELKINLEQGRQQLAQTRVQLESAAILREKNQAQIEHKRAEVQRNADALAEGLVSETDVTLLRNQLAELELDEKRQGVVVKESQYRVEELENEIARIEMQIAQTHILAPFAGRITQRSVEVGQTITAADPLFNLASFDPLYADVFVSELDSRRVRENQSAEILLEGAEEPVIGRVERVSPVVDNQTGTVKVTVRLHATNPAYRPGAFVRVRIQTDTREETTLIPKRAVIERDGETFVFVKDGETARRQAVELGYEDGDAVEVRSGVSAGDQIIVAGQGKLKDGDKTRIVNS